MYTSHGLYFFSGQSFEVVDGAGIVHKYTISLDENKSPCFYETAKIFGMGRTEPIAGGVLEGFLEGLKDRIDRIDTLLVSQEKELAKIKYLSGYIDVLNERIDNTDKRVEFFIDKVIGLTERYKEMFSKNKSKGR